MSHFKLIDSIEISSIIEKSKFIAYLSPIESEQAAKEIIYSVKNQHPKANHHCYAYLLTQGNQLPIMNQSDDGEPSKTAGFPMLEQLKSANLIDVIAVVTRYFGGTLLGTGGLIRAYSGAVKLAISEAKYTQTTLMYGYLLSTDYSNARQIEYLLNQSQTVIKEITYVDKVTFSFYTNDNSLILRLKQLDENNITIIQTPERWV
ncbi:YigZ family protein [Thorsellia anophelis]|uniref:Uncharacterized protein, YigZ family n=1 Tax=Thorsellia anophelis DSM 18579 TaxID=1123402 RepID=A0A1I0E0B6_9GAMM|nr:YigZ family protein [Thorsellia anophelis]SET37736.1 uncharacterized protein, YigZ family [Thorsellia anophelis DSM 18579]